MIHDESSKNIDTLKNLGLLGTALTLSAISLEKICSFFIDFLLIEIKVFVSHFAGKDLPHNESFKMLEKCNIISLIMAQTDIFKFT